MQQSYGTSAEKLIEYAGRLCYASVPRMGSNDHFIASRIREGHMDIVEHATATVGISGSEDPMRWQHRNRHLSVTRDTSRDPDFYYLVTGNLRVWYDLFKAGEALDVLPHIRRLAPSVFTSFSSLEIPVPPLTQYMQGFETRHNGPQRVTLLAANEPQYYDHDLAGKHGRATFLIEGISRACTHQLVRHRLASFSQESQRYVDLEKGGWRPIIPPSIGESDDAWDVLDRTWDTIADAYRQLRDMGIRKEDARFLLPNAAETRIVVTMDYDAWSHFFWLRALDKAAQWEIRRAAQMMLLDLYYLCPAYFHKHYEFLSSNF